MNETKQTISTNVCPQHFRPILLFCISPGCSSRLLCLKCSDSHSRHDLISVSYFTSEIIKKIQVNAANPDRYQLVKDLNSCKDEMLQRVCQTRNKLDGLLGDCQDRIQKYFSKLFYSLSEESHEDMLHRFSLNFTSENVSDFLARLDSIQKIILGSAGETSAIIYANTEQFRQKVNEIVQTSTSSINNLKKYIEQMSFAKPETFQHAFSREKMQKNALALSDGAMEVTRTNGVGGFPLSLLATPFSPCSTRVSFKLEKVAEGNKSIALGACLQGIVKSYNYTNCMGIGKGVYAIDQNWPYYGSNPNKMMSSWNHHDTTFNQSNVGSNDLVGWTIKEGDCVTLELDYYNSVLSFIKGGNLDLDEAEVYEMPIKMDQGPIYAFVSLGAKDDRVSILPQDYQGPNEEPIQQ